MEENQKQETIMDTANTKKKPEIEIKRKKQNKNDISYFIFIILFGCN